MSRASRQSKAADRQALKRAGEMDLSYAKMTDEQVLAAGERIELANGLRCGGCGRRIERGFHFTSIAPRDKAPVIRLCACSRDDCSYAAACRTGATFVEQVHYVWLDEAGADAAPAKLVVEQNDKLAAKQKPEEPERSAREQRAAQAG